MELGYRQSGSSTRAKRGDGHIHGHSSISPGPGSLPLPLRAQGLWSPKQPGVVSDRVESPLQTACVLWEVEATAPKRDVSTAPASCTPRRPRRRQQLRATGTLASPLGLTHSGALLALAVFKWESVAREHGNGEGGRENEQMEEWSPGEQLRNQSFPSVWETAREGVTRL